jgi:hypothetical protein
MIDFTKPVQTRDGRPVEIITTKGRGHWPVLGYIGDDADVRTWTMDGIFAVTGAHPNNLINVPEAVVGWVNVYERLQTMGDGWITKEAADSCAINRTALLKLTYIKGNATVEIIEEKA